MLAKGMGLGRVTPFPRNGEYDHLERSRGKIKHTCFIRCGRQEPGVRFRWFSMVLSAIRAPMSSVWLSIVVAALEGLAKSIFARLQSAAIMTKRVLRSRRPTALSTCWSDSDSRSSRS
jgi:hypothetical protein